MVKWLTKIETKRKTKISKNRKVRHLLQGETVAESIGKIYTCVEIIGSRLEKIGSNRESRTFPTESE